MAPVPVHDRGLHQRAAERAPLGPDPAARHVLELPILTRSPAPVRHQPHTPPSRLCQRCREVDAHRPPASPSPTCRAHRAVGALPGTVSSWATPPTSGAPASGDSAWLSREAGASTRPAPRSPTDCRCSRSPPRLSPGEPLPLHVFDPATERSPRTASRRTRFRRRAHHPRPPGRRRGPAHDVGTVATILAVAPYVDGRPPCSRRGNAASGSSRGFPTIRTGSCSCATTSSPTEPATSRRSWHRQVGNPAGPDAVVRAAVMMGASGRADLGDMRTSPRSVSSVSCPSTRWRSEPAARRGPGGRRLRHLTTLANDLAGDLCISSPDRAADLGRGPCPGGRGARGRG